MGRLWCHHAAFPRKRNFAETPLARDATRKGRGLTSIFEHRYTEFMRKMLACVLLAALTGCYYQGYAVRKVVNSDPPLSKEEVERLASAGVSDPVLLEMVEKRG